MFSIKLSWGPFIITSFSGLSTPRELYFFTSISKAIFKVSIKSKQFPILIPEHTASKSSTLLTLFWGNNLLSI